MLRDQPVQLFAQFLHAAFKQTAMFNRAPSGPL
jgi:hypothetical protein